MFRRLVILAVAGAAAGAATAAATWKLVLEPRYRTWGIDPSDAGRALAGDDIVPEPTVVDTRRIDIDAPPEQVWPWLVQMGYGRAGWYSYDAIDTAGQSGSRIVEEWQTLAEGDLLPTHPSGGFVVRALDPGRSLVAYMDSELVSEQASQASKAGAGAGLDEASPNVRATGAMMSTGFPADFAASWAFVLEPLDGGRTRLFERVRARLGEGTPVSRLAEPLMGMGVFLMTRRQMLGIRERAEKAAGRPTTPVDTSWTVKAPAPA